VPIRHCCCIFLLSLSLASLCHGQVSSGHQPPPQLPPQRDISAVPNESGGEDQARDRMASALAKRWNKERQVAIRKDTDKLLELAEELKAGVDKSNENLLALDVIKKAEEIEKLAHSVREKMKGPN